MGLFNWVREAAKAAFLAGIQDGVNELNGTAVTVPPVVLQLSYSPHPVEVEVDSTPSKGKKSR